MTDQPALEAEILLAHVLGKPRVFLHTWPEGLLSTEQVKQFANYIARRCNQEPIAYMTGTREFWSLTLAVSPDTLVPRPETELVIESVLAVLDGKDNKMRKVADLGTGCGAIGLALAHERPAWQIYATDISNKALHIAKKNAQRLAIENIAFFHGNWGAALPCADFDFIVSNPPYIAETEWALYSNGLAFEPRAALVSGIDGLDAIRQISQSAKYYLKPNGHVLVEHGFLQAEAVRQLFAADGYSQICSVRDLAGHERVTMACRPDFWPGASDMV